jgi:O-antigen ligase
VRLTRFSDIADRVLPFILTVFLFTCSVSGTAGSIAGGVAVIVFVLSAAMHRRSIHFREMKLFYWPTILFVLWMIVSAIVNGFDQRAAKAIKQEWILLLVPALVLVMSDEKYVRRLITVFSWGVGLISLYAVGQFFWGWNFLKPYYVLERNGIGYWIIGNFSGTVTFGIYFAVAGMCLIGYGLTSGNFRVHRMELLSGGLAVVAALLSAERGPFAAIVASVLALAMLVRTRRALMTLGLAILVIVAAGAVSGVFSRFASLWDKELSLLHDQGRRFIWTQSFKVAAENPVFGVGPGNFRDGYAAAMPTEPPGFLPQGHAHNDYLMYAAQSGIPELTFFAGMWAAVLYFAWRAWRSRQTSEVYRQLAFASLLGTICFAVTSMFDIPFGHSTTRQMLMFVWAAGLAAYLNSRRPSTA